MTALVDRTAELSGALKLHVQSTGQTFALMRTVLAAHELKLRTESAHVLELLARERVRARDVQWMALHRAHERERHARAATRVLHDRPTRPQPPVALARLDHRGRGSILHAAGRFLALELHQHARAARRHDVPPMRERMSLARALVTARSLAVRAMHEPGPVVRMAERARVAQRALRGGKSTCWIRWMFTR